MMVILVFAAFVITTSAFQIQEFLGKSSNQRLGSSVSISGNFAIAGSDNNDGSVTFYKRDSNTGVWSETQTFQGGSNDGFGFSVSISQNYAAVGEYGARKVYVYQRNGNDWYLDTIIEREYNWEDSIHYNDFGYSVAISDSFLIIGCPQYKYSYQTNLYKTGAVLIYPIGFWGHHYSKKLLIENNQENTYTEFGYSVSISGSYVLIGAPGYKNVFSDSGAAYIFSTVDGRNWYQKQKLTSNNPTKDEFFGFSVSISGGTLLIGGNQRFSDREKAVYIYELDNSNWNLHTKLLGEHGFGRSLSVFGENVIIGSPYELNNGVINSGFVFLYKKNFNSFILKKKFLPRSGLNEWFGYSVAITENFALLGSPIRSDQNIGYNFGSLSFVTYCSYLSCSNGGVPNKLCSKCENCNELVCQNYGFPNNDCSKCMCVSNWVGQNCETCGLFCHHGGIVDYSCSFCSCSNNWISSTNCEFCGLSCFNNGIPDSDCSECICENYWSSSSKCENCELNCYNGGTPDKDCLNCNCQNSWSKESNCALCGLQCENEGKLNIECDKCICKNKWIGNTCSQCSLVCLNGGKSNSNCSECICNNFWTGDSCSECNLVCQNGYPNEDCSSCICDLDCLNNGNPNSNCTFCENCAELICYNDGIPNKNCSSCICKTKYFGDYCKYYSCDDLPTTNSYYWVYENDNCQKKCKFGKFLIGNTCVDSLLIVGIVLGSVFVTGVVFVLIILFFIFLVIFKILYKKANKFNHIENVDIILKEAELEQNEKGPKIKLNKQTFLVPYRNIKLVKEIGSGGSNSTVFLVHWNNQKCAYKSFKTKSIAGVENDFSEFEKEINICINIRHPSILQFYGACIDKQLNIGILMEFCENGDIPNWLSKNRNKMNFKKKLKILRDVCGGLCCLHSNGIVHRDLKPENVLIDKNENAKIMDFGLSRFIQLQDKTMTKNIGTDCYMAPEVINPKGTYSFSCDVYSWAIFALVIMQENFSPYGPNFDGRKLMLTVAKNPNFRPKIKEEVFSKNKAHKMLKELIVRNWNHNPKERNSMEKIEKELKRIDNSTVDPKPKFGNEIEINIE